MTPRTTTATGPQPARPMTARLERFLVQNAERTTRALDRVLPGAGIEPRELHEAMRYAVLGGGKRLRPALVHLAYRAAGGSGQAAKPAACAIELVHAFSLVHDDLPCLDDDAMRRGQPTVHRRFGEATALLAGDALLALAFDTVARIQPTEVQAGVTALLAAATGSRGMIGGQALEEALGGRPDEAALREVHRLKTGRLFEASAGMGAIMAEAPPTVVATLKRYGRALGLAFQIADDLLDLDEPDTLSYPQNLGVPRAVQALRAAGATARRAICTLPEEIAARRLLLDLADYVVARGLSGISSST